MTKSIPLGVKDFQKIITGNYHYVDKTMMIKQIIDDGAEVYLYTRPRRFGKTLNLSMIDYFFNIKHKDEMTLFNGLKISEHKECFVHRSKYPIIRLNMSELNCESYQSLIQSMKNLIADMMTDFDYLEECKLSEYDSLTVKQLSLRNYDDDNQLEKSVMNLSRILKKIHKTPVIVLIDEYDSCIQRSYSSNDYDKSVEFLKRFFMLTFKANENLKFGIITGILRASKEGLFSGLNNVVVCDIFSNKFDEFYGFTESEVEELADECGQSDKMANLRRWYDGYRFGEVDVYNPWSILNCLNNEGAFQEYWVNSGSTEIIEELIAKHREAGTRLFQLLSSPEETTTMSLNLFVTYKDLITESQASSIEVNIYSMMVMSGYLKAVRAGNDYMLSIPNREVRKACNMLLSRALQIPTANMSNIYKCLISKDPTATERELNRLFSPGSVRDEWSHDDYKHALMILFQYIGYENITEMESGDGYIDIFVRPFEDKPRMMIEIKTTDKKDLGETASKALKPIVDRNYAERVPGNTIMCGIAFNKKECAVSFL